MKKFTNLHNYRIRGLGQGGPENCLVPFINVLKSKVASNEHLPPLHLKTKQLIILFTWSQLRVASDGSSVHSNYNFPFEILQFAIFFLYSNNELGHRFGETEASIRHH